MLDPNETLTIFGREVKQAHPGTTDGWELELGELLVIHVYPVPAGFQSEVTTYSKCDCYYETRPVIEVFPVASTKQGAVAPAESRAKELLTLATQACGGEVTWKVKQNGEAS